MHCFLFDASALAKRYMPEPGTALVNHLFAQVAPTRLSCLMLGAAEVAAALVRKRNSGQIDPSALAAALNQLRTEVIDSADFTRLNADNPLVKSAIALIERHPINSTDAVVLQAALSLTLVERSLGNDVVLAASDQRLLRAAQAEGLLTFDPESQTQHDLDQLIGP